MKKLFLHDSSVNPPETQRSSEQSWIDKSPTFTHPLNTGETEDIGFSGDVPEYTHFPL